MYDELVKKIRHCATDPMHCLSCGEDKDGRCFKRLMTQAADAIEELQKRVPKTPHGRLVDADALRNAMYHEAFEMDSSMQKWDSGCWIRYKMFERMEEAAPTILPAEPCKEKGE